MQDTETPSPDDLIGNTFAFVYAKETFHITLVSDSQLHWKQVKGEAGTVSEDTEAYIYTRLQDEMHYLSWTEKSGLALHNVLDFNQNTLVTHGNFEGKLFVNPGSLKKV